MTNRIFGLLAAVALLFCGTSFASNYEIPFNSNYNVSVNDGDVLILKDFPKGWGYKSIVLGVNASNGGVLSGKAKIGSCEYNLSDYYKQIVFDYNGPASIVYHGPSQTIPVQWWVEENRDATECSSTYLTREDSILIQQKNIFDSITAELQKDYVVLDAMNNEYVFVGSEAHVKISNLPKIAYNVINVLIEPLDGEELKGGVYAGNGSLKLLGWTETISMQATTSFDPVFEVAFPRSRAVKMKWWVSVETPTATEITSSVTNVAQDSMKVRYDFSNVRTNSSSKTLEVKYDKRIFKNGKPPVIKKFDIIPSELSTLFNGIVPEFIGDVYDIHAELVDGKSTAVALPFSREMGNSLDTVVFAHYIESENRWEKIKIDSIVDGYAYFQMNSFSIGFIDWVGDGLQWLGGEIAEGAEWTWDKITDGAGWTWDQFKDYEKSKARFIKGVYNGIATVAVAVVDGFFDLYETFVNYMCGDWVKSIDYIKDLFSGGWSIGQGEIANNGFGLVSYGMGDNKKTMMQILEDYASRNLNPISTSDYSDSWKTTSSNLDIVLADVIRSKLDGTYKRRFSFSVNNNDYSSMNISDANSNPDEFLPFLNYFQTKDKLLKDAEYFVEVLEHVYGAFNLTGKVYSKVVLARKDVSKGNVSDVCKNWLTGYGLLDWANDAIDGVVEIGNAIAGSSCVGAPPDLCFYYTESFGEEVVKYFNDDGAQFNPYADLMSEKDEWLQQMTSAMLKVAMISWLDKSEFRYVARLGYSSVYDGMMSWLDLASAVYGYNNLSIKAYAALALYEYIQYGTEVNLNLMNYSMAKNYGPNGGYSEGTGYSQYIWDEVPYALAALQSAYDSEGKALSINENFLSSAKYMLDHSRAIDGVGLVPVEVDDGCTYNPDYLVWSNIFSKIPGREADAAKYAAVAKQYPLQDEDKMLPMIAFGMPQMRLPKISMKHEKIPISNEEKVIKFTRKKIDAGFVTFYISVPSIETVTKEAVLTIPTIDVSWINNDIGKAYDNPSSVLQSDQRLWSSFTDDAGLISVKNAAGDTISLSMVFDNGNLLKNGQNHDQQDNLSITLASSKDGFIIQDRGYSGYSNDDANNVMGRTNGDNQFTHFYDHNVVTLSSGTNCTNFGSEMAEKKKCINTGVEESNRLLNSDEFSQKTKDFSGESTGLLWQLASLEAVDLLGFFGVNKDDLRVAGGDATNLVDYRYEPEQNLISGTACHKTTSGFENCRTIMYYEGAFWVIDRPTEKGAVWMANSPIKDWGKMDIKLYGMSKDILATESEPPVFSIKQNNNRIDYKDKRLEGYWHTLQDDDALTYVMTYDVNGLNMHKESEHCPEGFQCFENGDGTSRMVVPPHGSAYYLSSTFANSYAPITSNSIVIGTYSGFTWTFKAIGGHMYTPNGSATKNVIMNPNTYYYTDGAGIFHTESYAIEFLPAVPLLLLR